MKKKIKDILLLSIPVILIFIIIFGVGLKDRIKYTKIEYIGTDIDYSNPEKNPENICNKICDKDFEITGQCNHYYCYCKRF